MACSTRRPEFALFSATFDNEAACPLRQAAHKQLRKAAKARGLRLREHRPQRQPAGSECRYWTVEAPRPDALLREAERLKMELPLRTRHNEPLAMPDDTRVGTAPTSGCYCCKWLDARSFYEMDSQNEKLTEENADLISAPFLLSKKHLFYNPTFCEHSDQQEFVLTRTQRVYLIHSILESIDLKSKLMKFVDCCHCSSSCDCCSKLLPRLQDDLPVTLEHLEDSCVFDDTFALHDEASPAGGCCGCGCGCCCGCCSGGEVQPESEPSTQSLQQRLAAGWNCCCRFQPLGLVRLYFGERLAFYYAWLGYTVWCLIFLAAIGIGCFVFGIAYSSASYKQESESLHSLAANRTESSVFLFLNLTEMFEFVRMMFENWLTIPFGCIIIIWASASLEMWKRYEASLSYRWDVNNFQLAENRRVGSVLLHSTLVPLCCRQQTRKEYRRYFGLFSCLVSSVVFVFACTFGFQVARFVSEDVNCNGDDSIGCLMYSTVLPVAGNAIIIVIMDAVYSKIAKWITNWENHEYQSDYETSYVIKAFAFEFANNYSSLFYVAFVRQANITINGHTDTCRVSDSEIRCFSLLSITVIGFIFAKSIVRTLADTLLPWLTQKLTASPAINSLLQRCCCCCFGRVRALRLQALRHHEMQQLRNNELQEPLVSLVKERHLAPSRDLLMDEYLQNVITYGYVVLFGSTFFLTPVAALLVMVIDLQLDSKRLLHWHRRPVPLQADGIRVWNHILDFLNFAGIVTTGAILAFTSQNVQLYGVAPGSSDRQLAMQLMLFVLFENAMLATKLLLHYSIGDVPHKIKRSVKWEYGNIPKAMAEDSVSPEMVESLRQLHKENRWYNSIFPCLASCTPANPELAPNPV